MFICMPQDKWLMYISHPFDVKHSMWYLWSIQAMFSTGGHIWSSNTRSIIPRKLKSFCFGCVYNKGTIVKSFSFELFQMVCGVIMNYILIPREMSKNNSHVPFNSVQVWSRKYPQPADWTMKVKQTIDQVHLLLISLTVNTCASMYSPFCSWNLPLLFKSNSVHKQLVLCFFISQRDIVFWQRDLSEYTHHQPQLLIVKTFSTCLTEVNQKVDRLIK